LFINHFRRKYAQSIEERRILKGWHIGSPKIFPIFTKKKKKKKKQQQQAVASPDFEISLPGPAKASIFAWPEQLPQKPSHNFPHPSLSHLPDLLAKTREPLLLLPRLPPFLGQIRAVAH
jgi:hypothetical protein